MGRDLQTLEAKDGALAQNDVGICPVKLLLLALSVIRLFIISHVLDGNSPVNKLLEMFNTCRGVEDGSSPSPPVRRLKLTSRTTMLLDDTNSSGKPPDSELWDKLRHTKLVRSPRDGEMPLEASETSATVPSLLQVMPSQEQQSVLLCHDAVRPTSWDSPARNRSRERISCLVTLQ
uniref:Uncharacterized protein n=1 Tax=Oryza punctata TaxID=4537 RepID=A0A0E0M5R5_ORYPU